MPQPGLIIVDDIPSYRRVALIRAGRLDQIWFDDATRHPYQTGALVAVRITQHFAQHNRATVTLDGIPASLRLADHHQHKPGAMIAATIVSDARDDGFGHKPLQLKAAENTAPEDIPATPGLMAAAPDAMARALATAPDAHIHHDQDGALWAAHDLDDQLTAAQTPFLDLPGGGRLAITTPPGAAVIDIGINQIQDEDGNFKIVGDVQTEAVTEVAGWVTPVPGGVGPVTVAILIRNAIVAHKRQIAAGWIE